MSLPYTYRITFLPTGQHYYGSRTAKNCHPHDLWTLYFTSSKIVKKLIEIHGKNSFSVEIRKTFKEKEAAISWEKRVLHRLKVTQNNNWINQKNSTLVVFDGGTWIHHPSNMRDKLVSKEKLDTFLDLGYKKGRSNSYMTPTWRAALGAGRTGKLSPTYGLKRDDLVYRNKLPKRWMTNGKQDKSVSINDLEHFFRNGWIIGRTQAITHIKTKPKCIVCSNYCKRRSSKYCSRTCSNSHTHLYRKTKTRKN